MRRVVHLKCTTIHIILLALHVSSTAFPETDVEALAEGSAHMPCNILQRKDDGVEFIFWYKNDGVTALYTLDSRDRPLSAATHLRNETYSERVRFHVEGPGPPVLQMDRLREEDSGAYFCRVDFQWSATEIRKVNLVVVVPPKRLVIRDDSGQEIRDIAGPYKEKSDVSLFCEAQKGSPSPNVTWWKDNRLWDNTFKKQASNQNVVNEMRLTNLSRLELFSTFHCKAQNTKLAAAVARTVVLDLHLYPLSATIAGPNSPLSAGRPVELTCRTSGSRPSASVTWRLNGTALSDHSESVHDNATTSVLRLLPKPVHHGASLECRARNPKMPGKTVEETRTLNITYIPQVTLRLNKESEDRQPKEDDFVRLVCEVDANPPSLKVGWLFDDLPLLHNESRADIVSGSTLVFKRLTRRNKGRYRCYAINEEGKGMSEELVLNISHAPVCKENQQITYVVALNESVVVRCEVEAIPSVVTFKWEFSNTVHKHYNLQHTSEGAVSNATYRPVTPADYGTLFCWANNSIGNQQSSCFFTVIAPACKPEKTKANASKSSKDGSEEVWPHSALTAGAAVAASILIVAAVCAFYCRRMYIEKKKHRPMAQQILDEEVSIYSRVQCHNSGPQPRILIAK